MLCLVVALIVVEALGGDEHLFTREPGCVDRLTDPGLIAVRGSGVDVSVAGEQRSGDDLGRVLRGDLEDAESELRNRVAVGEFYGGDLRSRNSHYLCASRADQKHTCF